MVKELINRILDSKNLDELKDVGKIIFEMEDGMEKRMIMSVYRERKNAIINELKSGDSIFADIYWIIHSPEKSFSRVGKLLYKLKDSGLIPKSELSILFDLYEKKKDKMEKEIGKKDLEI